jgi:hypothetical protein
MSEYHKKQCLDAQKTLRFICEHPEGVTADDMKANGIRPVGIDRLQRLKLIYGEQIRHPEIGPRNYHWLWKAMSTKQGGK